MLDIKFLRENPDVVKQNIKNKFQDEKLPLVDEVIDLDVKKRDCQKEADDLRANRNKISKQIGALMGQGKKEEAEEVKRFLFKPDNNYRITYVAAGVSSRENVDDVIELDFSGEELEIRKNELIFYVHGKKLMELAHNIYQRCCK